MWRFAPMPALLLVLATETVAGDIVVPPGAQRLLVHDHAELLEDPERELTLEDVTGPAASGFAPGAGRLPEIGGTRSGFWLRFQLKLPPGPDSWFLRSDQSELNRICLYWPVADGKTATRCTGLDQRAADLFRWHQSYLFQVPADLDPERPIYAYAHSDSWVEIPLELITGRAMYQADYQSQFGWGVYYGIMLILALYGAVVYLGSRETLDIWFATHVGLLAFALYCWHGRPAEWNNAVGTWLATHGPGVLLGGFLWSGTEVYRRFLSTRKRMPWIDHALWLVGAVSLLAGVVALVSVAGSYRLLGLAGLTFVPLVLVAGFLAARQGFGPARWAMAAMAALLVGIVAKSAEGLGVYLVPGDFSADWLRVSALIAGLLLALGLGRRVHDLQAERNQAQELADAARQLARRAASTDEATSALTRGRWLEEFSRLRAGDAKSLHLVVLLIEGLESLESTHGPSALAASLRDVTSALSERLPPDAVIGRAAPYALSAVCESLPDKLTQPITLTDPAGDPVIVQLRAGWLEADPESSAPENLRRAYLSALAARIGELRRYEAGDERQGSGLEAEFVEAMRNGAVEMHLQPIISILGTARARGEALVRWRLPDGRMRFPGEFLPHIKSHAVKQELTTWLVEQCALQLKEWDENELVESLSVNLFNSDLRDPDLPKRLRAIVDKHGVAPEQITLELHETTLQHELRLASAMIRRLRREGFGLAIDDFGAGYTTLAYLPEIPLTTLKLDRVLIRDVPRVEEASAVLESIVGLGARLGIRVVAEGVETARQYDYLEQLRCDYAQGYLLGPAVPADEFIKQLGAAGAARSQAA